MKSLHGLRKVKSHWLIIILAFYFAFVLNLGFWQFVALRLELSGGNMYLFAASLLLLMLMFFVLFFSMLLIPVVGKPIIIILLLISSFANYAIYKLGIAIDSVMIRNVFETHPQEASDFITMSSVLWVMLTGVLPALLLAFCQIQYQPWRKELSLRALFVLAGLLIFGGIFMTSYKEYSSFFRNHNSAKRILNPVSYINSTARYFQLLAQEKHEFVWLDREAESGFPPERKNLFIFVVGEAARGMNFSLNGYAKETNPLLSGQDIVNFRNATSCGTSTAVSIPCMFSPLARKEFNVDAAKYTQNLLDVFAIADYEISWLDNNGCKGVCNRVRVQNVSRLKDKEHCEHSWCYDGVMLPLLEEEIKNQEKNKLIVLHMLGSHGPSYYQRYPEAFRKFTPTCDTADIHKCSSEEISNTYDNTILYADHFVSSVIDIGKNYPDRDITILYASDHGQSLGEGGVYLHGMPYAIAPQEQKQIAFLLWFSELAGERIDRVCLKEKARHENISHDHIFHSILGSQRIKTSLFDPALDIFQGCYTK